MSDDLVPYALPYKVTTTDGEEMGRYLTAGDAYQAIIDSGIAPRNTDIWEMRNGAWVHESVWIHKVDWGNR